MSTYLKYISILIFLGLFSFFTYHYHKKNSSEPTKTPNSKVKITASFYPLAEFTRQIGGTFVDVMTVTPAGTEPHEYEPTPQDIKKMFESKLVIFNGAGLDPWAEKLEPELKQKGVKTLNMSKSVEVRVILHETGGSESDPHFWLDPLLVQKEVEDIKNILIEIDPSHKKEYEKNAETYKKELSNLHQEYTKGVGSCKLQEIIVSHDAFSYLTHRYNLTVFHISGLSPDEEPSAKQIASIAKIAKDRKIKYIFFETLVNPQLSQTVANEVRAKTLTLNPLEGLTEEEIKAGKNYIAVMKDNLTNLKIALECQ